VMSRLADLSRATREGGRPSLAATVSAVSCTRSVARGAEEEEEEGVGVGAGAEEEEEARGLVCENGEEGVEGKGVRRWFWGRERERDTAPRPPPPREGMRLALAQVARRPTRPAAPAAGARRLSAGVFSGALTPTERLFSSSSARAERDAVHSRVPARVPS
jgi:hypothetical protein